ERIRGEIEMSYIDALGLTLLHFLWQGTLIAVLLGCALALLRHSGSSVRYALSCAAMLLMVTVAGATFLLLTVKGNRFPAMNAIAALQPAITSRIEGNILVARGSADYLPVLVWAWFGGVIALCIRSLGGWTVVQRLARRHTWAA